MLSSRDFDYLGILCQELIMLRLFSDFSKYYYDKAGMQGRN